MPIKEEDLYEPIRTGLQHYLCRYLGNCVLENTSRELTPTIRSSLDDWALFYIEKDKQLPDLLGSYQTIEGKKRIITVEIKIDVKKIDDIYQAKKYAAVFNAEYAFLISSNEIPERMKRFLIKRKAAINFSYYKKLIIATFNELNEEFEVDKEIYEGLMPEPFDSVYKPCAFCFDPRASREKLVGDRVITIGRKAYEMGGWLDDLVRSGRISLGLLPGIDLKKWLSENKYQHVRRQPSKNELGM